MMKRVLQFLIKIYAGAVSPFLPRSCRFRPTCSAYAHKALEDHGVLKGSWLALRRICRCHPLYKGPHDDPVPHKEP
ncbi:MAG: membrane protein insertion efficiency factor YidD [Alphaproteobacteria bacterium]|nr:membrane protein insertion efficiency factor YidD [Alphaproteobacteria bacterium]